MMGIPISSLPADLQRQLLADAKLGPRPAAPRRPRAPKKQPSKLMKTCQCGFQIFRPDGRYPDRCDGCGKRCP